MRCLKFTPGDWKVWLTSMQQWITSLSRNTMLVAMGTYLKTIWKCNNLSLYEKPEKFLKFIYALKHVLKQFPVLRMKLAILLFYSRRSQPLCCITVTIDCVHGSIRLAGTGSSSAQGRVEVCINNVWGTVCDDFWNSLDASIACWHLGYSSEGILRHATFITRVWPGSQLVCVCGGGGRWCACVCVHDV